jgi:hypothetical protein
MASDPRDLHLSWVKEQLVASQRELYDAERNLVEVQAKVDSLKGSVDYFYGILKLASDKEQVIDLGQKQRASESDSTKTGIQAKDLVRFEFAKITVKEAARIVIDRNVQPLCVEDLIKELYDVRTEEEELMVKRTLASELRRGATEGLWQKLGKTEYASNAYSLDKKRESGQLEISEEVVNETDD